MRSIIKLLPILLAVFAVCFQTLAQVAQVVVPNNLAGIEGNSSISDPFNSTSFRFQQVFDASQFAIPAGSSGRIDSITFRIDGASTSQVLLFFGGGSAQLMTTTRGPDELSSLFAENRSADAVTIWNGALSFGGPVQPGAMPQPWQFSGSIPVTSPFFYIPSQGNLMLEVAASGGQAFLPGGLDAHSVEGDPISWVWSGDGNSPGGTASTFGLVTRFDITIVPEPGTMLIALLGVGLLLVTRRK